MSNNNELDIQLQRAIDFPVLRFEPLREKTEAELKRYIFAPERDRITGCFLVCLRQKYNYEKEWEYLIEFVRIYEGDGIMWEMDWWEGQQNVEYLGICSIPYWNGKQEV